MLYDLSQQGTKTSCKLCTPWSNDKWISSAGHHGATCILCLFYLRPRLNWAADFLHTQTWLDTSGNNELHHLTHAKPDSPSLVSVLSHEVLKELHENIEQKAGLNPTLERLSWRGAVSFNYTLKSFLMQCKMPLEMNNILENSYFDLCRCKLRIYTSF